MMKIKNINIKMYFITNLIPLYICYFSFNTKFINNANMLTFLNVNLKNALNTNSTIKLKSC